MTGAENRDYHAAGYAKAMAWDDGYGGEYEPGLYDHGGDSFDDYSGTKVKLLEERWS